MMDRRQRKTREAIFHAFTGLLSQKSFHQITVGDIIDRADVGRATFYSHFETKDFLLKALSEELFCHIFDKEHPEESQHWHIFECNSSDSVFVHLFQHLQHNDHHLTTLLSSQNNELFLRYFKENLEVFIEAHLAQLESSQSKDLPESFWKNFIASTWMETLKWWIDNGRKESPEVIASYFFKAIGIPSKA